MNDIHTLERDPLLVRSTTKINKVIPEVITININELLLEKLNSRWLGRGCARFHSADSCDDG
jgi:hypothetical protein